MVFVGVVRDVDEPFRIFGGSSADPVTVEFEVSEVHKGDVPARMTLTTAMDGASCGYAFTEGSRYLVFAADYGLGLSTGLCSGNLDLAVESNPFGTGTTPRPAPPSEPGSGPIVVAAGAVVVVAVGALLVRRARSRRRAT